MGEELAGIIFSMVRWLVLHLSDKSLAKIVRVVRRLAYAFSGDDNLNGVFKEVENIFKDGPPGTQIVRRMLREAYRPYAVAIVRGFLGV